MRRKVLLVEDEALIALSETGILEKHGFEVSTAYSGEKAVATVEMEPDISLILMDIDLGKGIDGTEAAQKILGIKDLPIVFLTSHAEKEYVEKVKKITGYGYVLKNSGEFVLIESINMAYTLFKAKKESQQHLEESRKANREMEAREDRLRHLNRVLLSIRNVNQIITEETDVSNLLDKACEILVETSGYHQVWIVLTVEGNIVEPVYHYGFGATFAPMSSMLKEGSFPNCAKIAEHTRQIVVTEAAPEKCGECPFSEEHDSDGCVPNDRATMTMPLLRHGVFGGWISVILPTFYSEDPDERQLFQEIAGDLAYALNNLGVKEKERKKAREVEHLKNLFQYIIEHNPNAVAVHDNLLRYRYVSNRYLQDYRVERKDIIGKHHYDVFPDLPPKWREVHQRALKGELLRNDDDSFIRADGSIDYVRWECRPWYGEDGSVGGIVLYTEVLNKYKRAQEEIKEREESLRATLNSIGDAVISTDIHGDVVRMNHIAERLCGWDRESARGKPLDDVFNIRNSETRKTVPNPIAEVLQEGRIVGLANHTLLISKNGEEYQIADSASPVRDENGKVTGVVLVFRDVTEQYENEQRIRESEKKYRGLFTSIRDAILVADTDRNIIDCNPAFTGLFGYTLDEIQGKKTASVYAGEEEFEQMGRAIKQHKGALSDFLYTVHYKRKDSRVFPGETNVFYLQDDRGNITGFIGLIRDITERIERERRLNESETRFRNLFEHMSSCVAVYCAVENGNDFEFVDFNKAAEKAEKITKAQVVGKKVTEVFPGVSEFGLLNVFQRVWETGKSEFYPVSHYRDDRIVGWRENYVYKLLSGEIVAVYDDVTERKRGEENLKKALEEKELLMRELNHRVKNNLAMVSSLINLKNADDDRDLSDIKRRLDTIRIVHEKLYHPESREQINAKEYIDELVGSFFESFTGPDVITENNTGPCEIDQETAVPLGLIINETATNAMKHGFTEEKEKRFVIELKEDVKNSRYILTLSNTGKPFPEDIDVNTTSTLGLQLITSLVEQLNGTMNILKKPYPVFTIEFPQTKGESLMI